MGDVLFVACNQIALEPAVGAVNEHIECGPAPGPHFPTQPKYPHHPGAERPLARPSHSDGPPARPAVRPSWICCVFSLLETPLSSIVCSIAFAVSGSSHC